MEQERDYEIIALNILRQMMCNYTICQNIDLKWSCRLLKNGKLIDDFDSAIAKVFSSSFGSFVSELLVLITELYNKDGLDCANHEFRTFFNNIKQDFPEELKNMNASEFLKTLRNSIAHNSQTKQNFKAITHHDYSVHLKKKGASMESDKVFSIKQLLKILEVYDKYKKIEKHFGCVDFYKDDTSVDGILQRYKKKQTFNGIISFYDQHGELKSMDKFQDRALYRYLQKNRTLIRKSSDFEYFIMRFLPNSDNKFNHYEHKYHLSNSLDFLYGEQNLNCNKFVKVLEKEDPRGIIPFVDSEYMESMIISSMAFNMFSGRTATEMKTISDSAEMELSEELLNHIRNAFVHGRYFYNYDDGFEIYDGAKELSHIATVHCDTILKLSELITRPQFENHKKKKIQELMDNIPTS